MMTRTTTHIMMIRMTPPTAPPITRDDTVDDPVEGVFTEKWLICV